MLMVVRDGWFPFRKGFRSACCTKFRFLSVSGLSSGILKEAGNLNTGTVNGQGHNDLFPSTHWSVVLAAGRSEANRRWQVSRWRSFAKSIGRRFTVSSAVADTHVHDAQDLTQSFFAYVLEHKVYARVDRRKGRFRSFLLASLKNFLSDAADRERTIKRGGAQIFLPLHEEQVQEAESLFQTHSGMANEDRLFDRSWAEALVAAALERIATDYKREDKEQLFHELRMFIAGGAEPPPTYAELTDRLGVTESTLRSHVTRLRARYREALRAEVRRTVDSEKQVDQELRELLHVLTEM